MEEGHRKLRVEENLESHGQIRHASFTDTQAAMQVDASGHPDMTVYAGHTQVGTDTQTHTDQHTGHMEVGT